MRKRFNTECEGQNKHFDSNQISTKTFDGECGGRAALGATGLHEPHFKDHTSKPSWLEMRHLENGMC